jgi:hypothetical protein
LILDIEVGVLEGTFKHKANKYTYYCVWIRDLDTVYVVSVAIILAHNSQIYIKQTACDKDIKLSSERRPVLFKTNDIACLI